MHKRYIYIGLIHKGYFMPDETTFTAKIMVKGRVTVPQNERTLMNLGVGDFVKVTIKKIAKDMPTTT